MILSTILTRDQILNLYPTLIESIDDVEAYRRYLNTKEWIYHNYLRKPERRPDWILPTNV